MRTRFDVVYATSPPLFVGLSGYLISKIKRVRFYLEIRDLWPESAVVLGELSNQNFIRLSEMLEEFLYGKAIRIIGVTQGIVEGLKQRGVPQDKIRLIPNGANIELYHPGKKEMSVFRELDIPSSAFVVMYTGLHGLMHGLEFIITTANELKEHQHIQFVFIGDGVYKSHLVHLSGQYKLKNVHFLDSQPENCLPRYIRSFDVGLVTTKKLDFCRGTLPVKMFTYMASGKPVLLCVDGEARSLLNASHAGIYIEPENVDQLKKAILRLKDNSELCKWMGDRGRQYVEQHFSRSKQAEKLEQCLSE